MAEEIKQNFDPLNMEAYKIEKLPIRDRTSFEKWMARLGGPLAILAFILIAFVFTPSFLEDINPQYISGKAIQEYNNPYKVVKLASTTQLNSEEKKFLSETKRILKNKSKYNNNPTFSEDKLTVGETKIWDNLKKNAFSRSNIFMLAIFVAALILWLTEAIPNYLTSLILIIALVLTGVLSETDAYHQLGHKVMWLNILSFILASMLVATKSAKRFALWFVIKFGKNASAIFISFIIINVVLSAFISATTAKAAILLPIFMVIAAIYGATGGKHRNNFGRNLVLQNLFQINISAGAFITGSGANLLAGAMIAGAIGASDFLYVGWFEAAFPLAMILIIIGYLIGTKIIFPIPKAGRKPTIEGGMERLKDEYEKLGPIGFNEVKSIIIFVLVLAFWATDRYHGISKTAIAFVGAIIALLPGVGVVKWNDVDIPWHLLLFSAGAYTLGAGLDATSLAGISINSLFDNIGLGNNTPFWVFYIALTAAMIFSSLIFQSKTMRTLIFVPIAIGVAQRYGYSIMSLAFPVALLIEHVYVLPFNSKPAALLYVTDHYSWSDTFKFGFSMLVIGWIVNIIWGETWLRYLGHLPNGVFGIF